jgi:glycosyltransferase involved in cell wall biosynthesis
MPKISIIIPIYNSSLYLKRCIDSICTQTLRNIEIICINDCSTDDSYHILEQYSSKDKRIKIINLPSNKGESTARNVGISTAKGKYLGFVDSDDTVDSDFYRVLYKEAHKTDADIVEASMRLIYSNGKTTIYTNYRWFCSSVFSKEFIQNNNIYFPEEIRYGPDGVFMCRALLAIPKRAYVGHVYYNYHQITTSIMHNISEDVCKFMITGYDTIFNDISLAIRDSKISKIYATYLFKYFFSSFMRLIQFHFPDNYKLYAVENLLQNYNIFRNNININIKLKLTDHERELYRMLESADIDNLIDYFVDSKRKLASQLRRKLDFNRVQL